MCFQRVGRSSLWRCIGTLRVSLLEGTLGKSTLVLKPCSTTNALRPHTPLQGCRLTILLAISTLTLVVICGCHFTITASYLLCTGCFNLLQSSTSTARLNMCTLKLTSNPTLTARCISTTNNQLWRSPQCSGIFCLHRSALHKALLLVAVVLDIAALSYSSNSQAQQLLEVWHGAVWCSEHHGLPQTAGGAKRIGHQF